MKKRTWFILAAAILLAAAVCFGFYSCSQKSDIHIQVGIPAGYDEAGEMSAIYFDGFLKNQEETDIVLLAMVNAAAIPAENAPTAQPDAVISVHYKETGYPYYVWFGEDSLIIGNGTDFKEIHNDHTNVVGLVKNIADFLKNNQNNA